MTIYNPTRDTDDHRAGRRLVDLLVDLLTRREPGETARLNRPYTG